MRKSKQRIGKNIAGFFSSNPIKIFRKILSNLDELFKLITDLLNAVNGFQVGVALGHYFYKIILEDYYFANLVEVDAFKLEDFV